MNVGGYPFGRSWRGTFGVASCHRSTGWCEAVVETKGRPYIFLHHHLPFLWVCYHGLLQPATSPFLTHVNNGSEGFGPSAFSPCPKLSSFFSYILTFSRSVSLFITAALLFTFIRWRRFQGQLRPALSHKEEAWILFGVNDLGALITQRWVGEKLGKRGGGERRRMVAGTLFGRRLRNEMLATWNYRKDGKYMGQLSESKAGPLSTPGFDN